MNYLDEMRSLLTEREALFDRVRNAYEVGGVAAEAPLFAGAERGTPSGDVRAIERDLEALKARENTFLLRMRGH